MADVAAFIDHNRDLIATSEHFTTSGFKKEQVYRQYLPQVKDPKFPCITLSFEKDHMENFADIAAGTLFVSVHMKDFSKTQDVATWLTVLLHEHKFSNGTLIIYKCQEQGGPPTPSYDKDKECWESIQGFEVLFG